MEIINQKGEDSEWEEAEILFSFSNDKDDKHDDIKYCVHKPLRDTASSEDPFVNSTWPDGQYCVLKVAGHPCPQSLHEGKTFQLLAKW